MKIFFFILMFYVKVVSVVDGVVDVVNSLFVLLDCCSRREDVGDFILLVSRLLCNCS